VCGVVPLIVGETAAAAKAACDEVAAFGGGALVRQDTELPYTALQAALDGLVPFNANYWDKGVLIDWDPRDANAVKSIVDAAVKHWDEKPAFASKGFHVHPLHGGQWRGSQGRPRVHVLRRSQGTPLVQLHHRLGGRRRRKASSEQEVVRRVRGEAEPLSR
jgi:hypothetical protein